MSNPVEEPAPPVAKFKLRIEIKGNNLGEVQHELHIIANTFDLDMRGHGAEERESFRIIGGRSTRELTLTNPEQTPEKYEAELSQWGEDRRFIRSKEERNV